MTALDDDLAMDTSFAAAKRILVLGGAGFIGRHTVAALLRSGADVVVGTRHPTRAGGRLRGEAHNCERRRIRLERMQSAEQWSTVLADVDVVVNCVGILRERPRESYERVHHLGPASLALACAGRRIRLVHVSALGLENDPSSGFLKSKRQGEKALMRSDLDWHLVRPSLLDGEGGYGARWVRRCANWPCYFLPAKDHPLIAPLDARDLGRALANLALDAVPGGERIASRIYELGGVDNRTLKRHLLRMRSKQRTYVPSAFVLPVWLARLMSHLCDIVHWTPYSFGHFELLQHDNVPALNRLPELLGRAPRIVDTESLRDGRVCPGNGPPQPAAL